MRDDDWQSTGKTRVLKERGTMTKQHFEFIAEVLKPFNEFGDELSAVTDAFADKLAETNPKFDRARFLKAAGVE